MLTPEAEAALDNQLDRWSRERDLSGTVLITRAGATVLERCYGMADRAAGIPVTPETRFGLASMTKLFTAVAVAAGTASFTTPTAVTDTAAVTPAWRCCSTGP